MISLGCFSLVLSAQQDEQYTIFPIDKLIFNPGYAGAEQMLSATGVYRKQWQGFEGSPESQYLSIHTDLPMFNSGVGIHIQNDVLGAENTIAGYLTYSYGVDIGEGTISMGLSAGIAQKSLDGSILRAPQGNYENGNIDHNDVLLSSTMETSATPDFNVGAYYKNDDLEVGVGMRHVASTRFNYDISGGTTSIKLKQALYVNAGYGWDFATNFKLLPAILFKSDFASHTLDINARVVYNSNIWFGLSFRGYDKNTLDAGAAMVGLDLNNGLRIGYAYDLTISDVNRVSNGSHEILLNYRVPLIVEKPGKVINNLRFLSR